MDNFKREVGWLEIEILSDPPAKSWRLPTQDVFYPPQASRARRLPFNCAGTRRQLLQDALKKPRRKTKDEMRGGESGCVKIDQHIYAAVAAVLSRRLRWRLHTENKAREGFFSLGGSFSLCARQKFHWSNFDAAPTALGSCSYLA